ncbi:MAG TPA: hypothetical protein VHW09_26720 [Bryobacteraceae bacterium]|jgi:hypothetical protein|nr:hypothetical protein [Bryobacteraceae bacterium]
MLVDVFLYYAIGFVVWGWCVNKYVAYMSTPAFIKGLFYRPFLWPVMLWFAAFKWRDVRQLFRPDRKGAS